MAKAVEGEPNLLVAASQLVGIAAAGATEGDVQKGAEIAKNATTYNFLEHLPPGLAEYGQAATTLADDMRKNGATVDEIAQAQAALAQGQGFDGAQPANEFVKAWGMFLAGELTGAGLVAVIGRLWSLGAKGGSAVADDFFAGTKYTDKVLGQIKTGDLHGFPESVTTFQGARQVTKITGGDGVVRDMLKIPGEYRGKQGVFEFIKESDGSINHRLFKPTPAE
ncbi:MAG TPA: VENN motif pre-toxin domain-containing protein [Pseudomonas sp.]|uniref:VENN motif pre-toxin domain-containing protein n=1 Tax=Pseudomonas sp. TaxID=306 RepID=UPI002ED98B71